MKIMEIRVSVIMLVYNHERFIRHALDSILSQRVNFEYELIIGEDCSPDNSKAIIKEYENKFKERLHAIYREKNIGVKRNFLDCLGKCRGKYIAFLEGDDCWTDPLKLQKMSDFLHDHSQYSAVAHNYSIVDAENRFLRKGLVYEKFFVFTKEELAMYRLPSQTSTLMIRNIVTDLRKNYLEKIKKYMWIPGDRILALLLLQYGDIAVLPDVMSVYRYYIEAGGTNWSSNHPREDYLYIFRIMCGMEKLGKKIKCPLDMKKIKVFIFQKNIDQWTKSKLYLYVQCLHMLILEKHKTSFLKPVLASYK